MTEWYFVWVEGLRGPMPQKWSSDDYGDRSAVRMSSFASR